MGGKTIIIEVEVVDAPLDYNILLGRNWMYNMQAIASSLFQVVCFLFNGNIITIDQNSFQNPCVNASSGASIPIINHSQLETKNVGVGMYPSLMGTFSCPTPILMIGYSFGGDSSSLSSMSFRTTHMEDPWILPSPSTLSVPIETNVPLPTIMVAYQANIDHVVEPSPSSSWIKEDPYVFPAWEVLTSSTL